MPVIVCYSFNKVISNRCLLLIEYESGDVQWSQPTVYM